MRNLFTNECFEDLRKSCERRRFKRRGRAFFRVHGDGVLQVVKFEYEPGEMLYELRIGLFSMYGNLRKEWFTSAGCIPRYAAVNLVGVRDADASPFAVTFGNQILVGERSVAPEEQLRIMEEKGFSWLDGVDTQQKLLEAFFDLEQVSDSGFRWLDSVKYAPFLRTGSRENAVRVILAILDQHHMATEHMRAKLSDEAFAQYTVRIERSDAPYLPLLDLARCGEQDEIDAWLMENYRRNCGYAKFCMGN